MYAIFCQGIMGQNLNVITTLHDLPLLQDMSCHNTDSCFIFVLSSILNMTHFYLSDWNCKSQIIWTISIYQVITNSILTMWQVRIFIINFLYCYWVHFKIYLHDKMLTSFIRVLINHSILNDKNFNTIYPDMMEPWIDILLKSIVFFIEKNMPAKLLNCFTWKNYYLTKKRGFKHKLLH